MPSPRLALLAALLIVPVLATPAHAGGPPGTVEPIAPEAPPETHTVRYGWQTFAADVTWFAAAGLLSKSENGGGGGGAGTLIALGYYGGGPAIHLLHHNASAARKSLALRLLVPVAGALAGIALTAHSSEDPGFEVMGGAAIGFAVGAVTAMVIDWTVLSKKTEESRPGTLASLRPAVGFGKRAVAISIAGSF